MSPAANSDTVIDRAAGAIDDLWVSLRRVGEGLCLESLARSARGPVATVVEGEAGAAVFWAPRSGPDRYPDWTDFEQACRFPSAARSRVWRIAFDSERVCCLGQHLPAAGDVLPLAAALWRGWLREPVHSLRGLFWQGQKSGHLWLVAPRCFPRHVAFAGEATAEAVLVALECHADLGALTLEVGGLHHQVASELKARLGRPMVPVEPFARLLVPLPLREQLCRLADRTAYLPAVGAALALIEGPPTPLSTCASYPAAAAGAA